MDKSSLGNRMKNYETRQRSYLQRRVPVIARLDIRSGSNYTKGMERPFDNNFVQAMNAAALALCKEEGVQCAFTSSDEITLLFLDTARHETQAYFDYQVMKMCSVLAGIAANAFNKHIITNTVVKSQEIGDHPDSTYNTCEYAHINDLLDVKMAVFDCRVSNIPREEVNNNFLWRQRDTVKNSISMLGQSHFSHKDLHKKNGNQVQEMLITQKGVNWNDLHPHLKRGRYIEKRKYVNGIWDNQRDVQGNRVLEYFNDSGCYAVFESDIKDWVDLENPTIRNKWVVVEDTPDFSKSPETINNILKQNNL